MGACAGFIVGSTWERGRIHKRLDRIIRQQTPPQRNPTQPWPFDEPVTPRQVERQELIDRQYAHIPPKVKW
jgi:hypothetical protein